MPPQLRKNIQTQDRKGSDNDTVYNVRTRFTIAEVNAGAVLLPAVSRQKYRIVDIALISIGGAVGAATAVIITAVRAGATISLLVAAVAALTQSALLRIGAANAVILADGESFIVNDVNTPISIGKTGSTATTATHVDVILSYVIENG